MDVKREIPDTSNLSAIKPLPAAQKRLKTANRMRSRPEDFSTFAASFSNEKSIIEHFAVLARHIRFLSIAVLIGVLLGYVSYVCRTKIYRVHTTIEFQELNEDVLNKHELDPNGSGPGDSYFATQVKILQSESLLERVISKMKLEERPVPEFETAPKVFFRRLFRLPEPPVTMPREFYRTQLTKGLKVKPLEETRIVDISCDFTDPEIAADVVNTMAKEYVEQSLEERYNAARRTTDWLNKQIDTLRVNLKASEEKLLSYGRTSGLMVSVKENPSEDKLRHAETDLDQAQAERVVKQAHYEAAQAGPVVSVPEVMENPTVREYQIRLTDLQRQLADLSATLTPRNPKVLSVQAQIDQLQLNMEKERVSIVERLRSDYNTALRREKILTASVASLEETVNREAGNMSQMELLRREVDTNRQVYVSMLQRVKEYGIAVALPSSQVHIVDRASPPARPYSPNLPFSLGLSFAGSFAMASAVLLYREHNNPTFARPGEAARFLNVSELGAIPVAKPDTARLNPLKSRIKAKLRNSDGSLQGEVISSPTKNSRLADSVRTTLVSILFSHGAGNQIIVVTSPCPGEGKSTVIGNLAIALAETDHRVLLIDGDLRKPRLHDIFGIPRDKGLANLLHGSGEISAEELKTSALSTSIYGISVMPAGIGGSVSDLLYSKRWSHLLQRLRSEFDVVLIDTPPVLHMPDARVLSRLADSTVLILNAKRTLRSQAAAAVQRIEEDGANLLGVILNEWDPDFSAYGDYSDYAAPIIAQPVDFKG